MSGPKRNDGRRATRHRLRAMPHRLRVHAPLPPSHSPLATASEPCPTACKTASEPPKDTVLAPPQSSAPPNGPSRTSVHSPTTRWTHKHPDHDSGSHSSSSVSPQLRWWRGGHSAKGLEDSTLVSGRSRLPLRSGISLPYVYSPQGGVYPPRKTE